MKVLWFLSLLLFSSIVFSQEAWQKYQESNSRVALMIESSDSQSSIFRNVVRLFATSTIGDTMFWLSKEITSGEESSGFACEDWRWQGVLNNSLVFEVSKYIYYIQDPEANTIQYWSLKDYKEQPVGSKSWGEKLFSLCSSGKVNVAVADMDITQIFIPLPNAQSSILLTPSGLWNQAVLNLTYNQWG